MFTGLIETTGRLRAIVRTGDGARLTIETSFADELERGESIAVNGVCLTVVSNGTGHFDVDAVAETLRVSTLGTLRTGARLNLERALRLGDRLGGHIVSGHVDGQGTVVARRERGTGVEIVIELPAEMLPEVVAKGSIAIDGTSLTVASTDGALVTVALIPETLRATVSGDYRRGTRVNVETDVLAKHIRKLQNGPGTATADTDAGEGGAGRTGLTLERLRELGF